MKNSISTKLTATIALLLFLGGSLIGYFSYLNSEKALFSSFKDQALTISKVLINNGHTAKEAEHIAEDILNQDMMAQAFLMDELLKQGKVTNERLKQIAKQTGIGEFWITDAKGIVTLTNVDAGTGWVFPTDPAAQASEFRKLIGKPGEVVTQPSMNRDLDDKYFKYVGVGRSDQPGIVQVGMEAEKVVQLKEKLGMKTFIDNLVEKDIVDYVMVVNKEGKVELASGIELEVFPTEKLNQEQSEIIEKNGQEFVQVVVPDEANYFIIGLATNSLKSGVAQEIGKQQQRIIAVCLGISIILIVLIFLFSKSLAKPLEELAQISNKVAAGELYHKVSVKSQDEVGIMAGAYQKMLDQFSSIIKGIGQNTRQLTNMSSQFTSAASQVVTNANETAITMGQISNTVDTVSVTMQRVAGVSNSTNNIANEGNQGIERVIQQMDTIAHTTRDVSLAVDGVSKKSQEINHIVELITKIADQTNLLALNAAIEAARAGENGRGFAVVSDEVRKLAEQSRQAAKEISGLVSAIQNESTRAVNTMAESRKEVESGNVVVQEVGYKFKDIINGVQGLTLEIESVTSHIEQMASGIQNIAASTEEQTASMQEVSANAESLAGIASQLDTMVQKFKV
ncbi:methyl-accepting chemotaxis protein [Desulfotomaculum sp. 1211_IL3151]|uniref:methyl-accepting chemotaxis protein n=1 Tax=Desulfotomaculum sp. 1211_IL3151 TaxID=3084055 RepID=UPI002FDB34A5